MRRTIAPLLFLAGFAGCATEAELAPPALDSATVARIRAMRSVPIRDRFARARVDLVRAVNADRAAAGLAPVTLDSLASVAAQRHADAMAEEGFFSHYGPGGETPYERLAALGGTDHVLENVYRWEDRDADPLLADDPWRRFEPEVAESALLASAPHRAAILDPHRTGVGLGFAVDVERRTVYVVQEFVSRHAALIATPVASSETPARVQGRVLRRELAPLLIVLRREPAEYPWERSGVPPPGPYDDGGLEPRFLPPWEFTWRADGTFALELGEDLPPGRYYGVLYVAPASEVKTALTRRRAYPRQGWPGAAFLFEVRRS